jgi:hypothetical protein
VTSSRKDIEFKVPRVVRTEILYTKSCLKFDEIKDWPNSLDDRIVASGGRAMINSLEDL